MRSGENNLTITKRKRESGAHTLNSSIGVDPLAMWYGKAQICTWRML